MENRELMVGKDGATKDVDGKWRMALGAYNLVQHSSDYNAVYFTGTGEEVTFRTTWNAALRIAKLLDKAYELGRKSVLDGE